MLRAIALTIIGLVATLASASILLQAQQTPEQRKVALLVGVNKYERRNFDDLSYAERDVDEVGAELTKLGFTVVVLKGSADGDLKATRDHIDTQLLRLLEGIGKNDLVFVMFSGHGQQFPVKRPDGSEKEDAFFCPVDAIKDDAKRLFSVSYLIDEVLANRGGRNLVLIDACRDEPKDASRSSKGVQGRSIALPEETAVFFSCRAGQRSFENEQAGGGHGLFTYCLLDGMRGRAVQNETLTWTSLVGHVENMMDSDEIKKLLPPDRKQEPLPAGNVGRVVLARITARPGATPMPEPPKAEAPELLTAPFDEKEARAARKAWAQYQQVDEERKNSLDIELVLIPAGRFLMGSPETVDELIKAFPYAKKEWFAGERPVHRVSITQPFYLGKYEVTKAQFRKFVEETGYKTDAEKDGKGGLGYTGDKDNSIEQRSNFTWRDWGVEQSDESPVVNVSHNDAVAFCEWLSKREGKKYRLPTEAEWEYACRAGTTGRYYNGDDPEASTKIGNVGDAALKEKIPNTHDTVSSSDGWPFTSPVGRFRPNSFGLYDMIGNAWEWCSDWYGEDYYANSPEHDPTGPNSGSGRVRRGGSWDDPAGSCRSAPRGGDSPESRSSYLGFRLARSSEMSGTLREKVE